MKGMRVWLEEAVKKPDEMENRHEARRRDAQVCNVITVTPINMYK